ncbi:MAG: response regulator [Clostridia bacterium]|nr:response regulator [Clostridia bacterium]NLS85026.1 response regulator [Oscillospiraceae bacterium]
MVLLDIIMPMMDGIEVLKWLSASKYNGIPVIAVTAEPSYQLEALENGAWDFIAKPVASSIIKARVNNVLSRCTFERIRDDMGAPLTPATFQRLLSMTELYSCLVSESQSAIYVSGTDTYDFLFINDAGLSWLGKDGKNYSGKNAMSFYLTARLRANFAE